MRINLERFCTLGHVSVVAGLSVAFEHLPLCWSPDYGLHVNTCAVTWRGVVFNTRVVLDDGLHITATRVAGSQFDRHPLMVHYPEVFAQRLAACEQLYAYQMGVAPRIPKEWRGAANADGFVQTIVDWLFEVPWFVTQAVCGAAARAAWEYDDRSSIEVGAVDAADGYRVTIRRSLLAIPDVGGPMPDAWVPPGRYVAWIGRIGCPMAYRVNGYYSTARDALAAADRTIDDWGLAMVSQ